jgi:enamine deaminase RidA (YjgF/YER057c/UK114 family)
MNDSSAPQIESIWPGLEAGVPKPLMPYSPAIRAGQWVFIAGTIASDFKTGLAPEVRYANTNLAGELYMQSEVVLRNLGNTMKAAGCDPRRDMVRLWQWFVSARPNVDDFARGDHWADISIQPYLDVRDRLYGTPTVPASALGVKELLCLGTRVEVDMICRTDDHEPQLLFAESQSDAARLGHAAGIRRGDWIFLAAHNALDGASADPVAASLWAGSSVEAQADAILEKLAKLADSAGSGLAKAVKAEVYIGHPSDFAAMDRAWKRWFPERPPARVVIPYMGMGRRGARIEIALTLLANDSRLQVQTIEAAEAPPGLGHEPQAVKAGDLLFFSTQMAFAADGKLADGMVRMPEFPWYGSPGKAQMHYMMGNIAHICSAANTSVENIVRRVCFHSDFQWFAESIEAWASYFPDAKPASTTIRLEDPLVVPGANTLLDLVAYAPD